jgi:toxin ParE1/3/4
MKYIVYLADSAENDVAEIGLYIAEQAGLDIAHRILDGLDACWNRLSMFPERGNIPKELLKVGRRDCRELHFKQYRIIYRVEGKRVMVFGVADGRRNMETYLFKRLEQIG